MIWLIELLILAMTVLLIHHAKNIYDIQWVIAFWVGGMIMGILREIAMSSFSGVYQYGEFHLTLLGIPVVYAVLWTNFAYTAWQWSNNYLGREYLQSSAWDQHLPLIFITGSLISFFFEALLSQFGLINWQVNEMPMLWGSVPLLAPFSYGFTLVLFMHNMRWIAGKVRKNLFGTTLQAVAIQPVVVLELMGLLFLINLMIIIIFS